jgi:hypothetical protein
VVEKGLHANLLNAPMSSQCYPNLEVLPAQMNVFKMSGIIDAFESSRDKKNTADLLWKKYQTLKHVGFSYISLGVSCNLLYSSEVKRN